MTQIPALTFTCIAYCTVRYFTIIEHAILLEAVLKEAKFLHFSDWPDPKVRDQSPSIRNVAAKLTVFQPWIVADRLLLTRRSLPATLTQVRNRKQTAAAAAYG